MDKSKWEFKKLGDCFAYIKNGANIKQINGATGIPITRIETLSNDVFNRDRMGYANIEDVTSYSSYILNDGDILMSHINSMKFLGRAVEYKKKDDEIIIHGMNLLRMIPTSYFFSSYAVYQFKTDHFRKQIKAISHQAVNQASFNVTNLKGLNLIVPPIADQQRIVAELDCLNEMIALKQEQLKEFDKLAQSIFYDMFGDPITNEKGWKIKKLEHVCQKITDGTHNSPVNTEEGEYMYVTAKNIKKDGIILDDITYVSAEVHKVIYARCNPQYGDVLYIKDGVTTGIATINTIKEEFSLLSSVALLKPGNDIVNYYLKAVLNTPSLYVSIRKNMGGAAITRLTITKINSIDIPLPPLALQQQFAEKIQAIEAQKEFVKKSIVETQHLLDSRMDYYFN